MNIFRVKKLFIISTLICFVIEISGEFPNHENCGQTKSQFIVGGVNAEEKEFPFMVSLQVSSMGNQHFCGGSVLNKRWVLTAAHCIILSGLKDPSDIVLVMGSTDNKGLYIVKYKVEKWIINGCFTNITGDQMGGDIALLKTDKDIDFNETRIGPICLPPKDKDPVMKKLTIAGWGAWRSDDERTPNKLQKTQIDVFPEEYCRDYSYFRNLGTFLWPIGKRICLIAEGATACRGDSGGPAFHTIGGKVYQFGIASFISGLLLGYPVAHDFTCEKSNPVLYVKVSKYIDWITESINNYSDSRVSKINTKCPLN